MASVPSSSINVLAQNRIRQTASGRVCELAYLCHHSSATPDYVRHQFCLLFDVLRAKAKPN